MSGCSLWRSSFGILASVMRNRNVRVDLDSMSVQDSVSLGLAHPWMVTACPGVSGIFIAASRGVIESGFYIVNS